MSREPPESNPRRRSSEKAMKSVITYLIIGFPWTIPHILGYVNRKDPSIPNDVKLLGLGVDRNSGLSSLF